CSEIQQVELRVVRHRVPYRAATAHLPGLGVPGRTRLALQNLIGGCAVGLPGHGVETPDPLAGLGVEGADQAARLVLRAGAADDDLALHHSRRTGNGVGLGVIDRGDRPYGLARGGIERDEMTVD